MGSDITSEQVYIAGYHIVTVEIAVDNTSTASTGTAAGNFYVQVSNSGLHWFNLWLPDSTSTSEAVSSGSDLNVSYDFDGLGFRVMRVFYDRTSGDGIADCWVTRKRIA